MIVVSKMAKARHARTAVVILSICVAGCLFMESPLLNAQENEDISINDRLENIEGKLDNLHSSYVTREIFDIKLSAVNQSIDRIWQIQLVLLATFFGAFVTPILADTYKKLKT